jgi:tRNA A-37 threonylcarbamoyl transferase component Bud32
MATIDIKSLRKAVVAAIKDMNERPGAPAPRVSANHDQVSAASGLIFREFEKEFQAIMLRDVRRYFAGDSPSPGCLKRSDGPFTKIGDGVQGCAWLSKDKKRAFKIGRVGLRDELDITRKFEEARSEFAIAEAAGELGVGPKVHDAYFCCDEYRDKCYYVISMDYVPGKSLYEWHKGASAAKREAMRRKLLAVVRKMGAAGIEHADLHAENVIVARGSGEPVVIDYGMASWAGAERVKDELFVNRFFSDTTSLKDAAYHVAKVLIHNKTIKVSG